jgi:two-component system CheB/CheR fusion protein
MGVLDHQLNLMARLVDDLLDVSGVTRGAIRLQPREHDVADIVGHAVQAMQSLAAARMQKLMLTVPGNAPWANVDPHRLEQVVSNLLSNAIKCTPDGGTIFVNVGEVDGKACIRVRDNGIGLEPGELERVFELFWQGEKPLHRPDSGLGIGLSLARHLVEAHGGTLTATSQGWGHGSEFVVMLPALAPADRSPVPPRSAGVAAPPGPLQLLIVDDNTMFATILELALREVGQTVRVAHTAMQAVASTRAYTPDVVLLDLGLPDMDGFQLATLLRRSQPKETVLVALTGYGQESDRRRARDAGCDYHLLKPPDFDELLAILASVAQGRGSSQPV